MFACTSLAGVNKVGTLKKNADGYYPMVVGALNVFNSGGQFYPLEGSKQLFDESSSFQRRIKRAALRGEYGHPKPLPRKLNPAEQKLQDEDFARRNLTVFEENVCVHHMKIWLDYDSVKDANGKAVVAIMSLVSPNGPLGHVLEKQLENKNENVCFSIRSFTDNKKRFGVEHRTLREVVTFDYVNEPGISIAEKYLSPALENLNEVEFSRASLEQAIYTNRPAGISTESLVISGDALFNALDWAIPGQGTRSPITRRW